MRWIDRVRVKCKINRHPHHSTIQTHTHIPSSAHEHSKNFEASELSLPVSLNRRVCLILLQYRDLRLVVPSCSRGARGGLRLAGTAFSPRH